MRSEDQPRAAPPHATSALRGQQTGAGSSPRSPANGHRRWKPSRRRRQPVEAAAPPSVPRSQEHASCQPGCDPHPHHLVSRLPGAAAPQRGARNSAERNYPGTSSNARRAPGEAGCRDRGVSVTRDIGTERTDGCRSNPHTGNQPLGREPGQQPRKLLRSRASHRAVLPRTGSCSCSEAGPSIFLPSQKPGFNFCCNSARWCTFEMNLRFLKYSGKFRALSYH